MRITTVAQGFTYASVIERAMYLTEVGYGMLDIGTCSADQDDSPEAAGALGTALLQRLAERGVL